jgi:hypothetical protein
VRGCGGGRSKDVTWGVRVPGFAGGVGGKMIGCFSPYAHAVARGFARRGGLEPAMRIARGATWITWRPAW